MTPPDDKAGASETSLERCKREGRERGVLKAALDWHTAVENAGSDRLVPAEEKALLDAARALGRSESSYAAGWKAGQESMRDRRLALSRCTELACGTGEGPCDACKVGDAISALPTIPPSPLTAPPPAAEETKDDLNAARRALLRLRAADLIGEWVCGDILEKLASLKPASPPPAATATERGETCECPIGLSKRNHFASCPLYRKEPPGQAAYEAWDREIRGGTAPAWDDVSETKRREREAIAQAAIRAASPSTDKPETGR